MDCTDVSTILDERRETRLTRAEHCAVDTHLGSCADCASAWHAQAQLRALPIPPTPAGLLERALAAHALAPPRGRRATPRIVLGAAILAGGAALAMTYVAVRDGGTFDAPATTKPAAPPTLPPPAAPDARASAVSVEPGAPSSGRPWIDRSVLPDSDLMLVARAAPEYPRGALERGEQGSVTISLTVTEQGRVADAVAIGPSDAAFAPAALAAVAKWTYLPRVIDGEPVAAHGVVTSIRFQLTTDASVPAKAPPGDPISLEYLSRQAQRKDLDAAWRCLSVHELRCAELILDELVATYELTPQSSPNVWDFYGYLYTQYGDYGRAIAAYEAAIADGTGSGWDGEWLALAHLYFARAQYDMAMKTLRRYTEKRGANDLFRGTEAFLEKLRSLGITEDAL